MAYKPKFDVDQDQIKRLYVEQGLTTRQIAAQLGISPRTVARRLHEFGIQPKPKGAPPIEILRNAQWLYEQYVTLRKTSAQIAQGIGASERTVIFWVHRHGIEVRPCGQNKGRKWSSEVRKRMSKAKKGRYFGADNPNWKGGLRSDYARERTSHAAKEWSKAVRKRDGHKCVECGAKGKLHAHHIKPFKHHPELRYDVGNGITLCPPCHQKAHDFKFPAWVLTNPYHDEIPTSAEHSAE